MERVPRPLILRCRGGRRLGRRLGVFRGDLLLLRRSLGLLALLLKSQDGRLLLIGRRVRGAPGAHHLSPVRAPRDARKGGGFGGDGERRYLASRVLSTRPCVEEQW